MTRVITFGTYDLFHVGHLNMLKRAKALGTYLAVGVSSDELNIEKKERTPIYPLKQRLAILRALKCVDEVFVEESLEKKAEYCKSYDIFVIGDDWRGKFDHIKTDSLDVIYLPRTPEISTTEIINKVKG
jgi:glycerol-3-phosphate cytidylyltransferase